MKRLSLATFLLLLLLCSGDLFSQEKKVAFDLKTKFAEKLDMTGVKNGALLILMESDWASVTEFGEDYALWLRNPHRERRGDSILLSFDLEVREGTLYEEGELLKSRSITIGYDIHDDWKSHGIPSVTRVIEGAESCVQVATAVGEFFHPVATKAIERVVEGIELLLPADYPTMKLEAMVAGASVVSATKEMVGEITAEKQKGVDPGNAVDAVERSKESIPATH